MNLTQLLLVLKARKKIILSTLVLTVIGAILSSLLLSKGYTATAEVVIDSPSMDLVTGTRLTTQTMPAYIATQVDIIGSHSVATRVVDNLGLANDPKVKQAFLKQKHGHENIRDWVADTLLSPRLYVKPSHESNVIQISYTGATPRSAAVIANAFVTAYIQTNLDLKTQPAKGVASWYDQQLKELRDNLENSQNKLAQYEKVHGIVISGETGLNGTSSAHGSADTARYNALSALLVEAQAKSYDSQSKSQSAAKGLPDVINNPTVQSINIALSQQQAKLSQLASTDGPNNPEYKSALAEVNKLRQELASQTEQARQSIATNANVSQQSEASLRNALAAQKSRLISLENQQDEGAVLLRDVNNAQRMYDTGMSTYGQFKLKSKANQSDISILNPAVPPTKPNGANKILVVIASIFLGGLLGLGFGIILEMMDRRVRGADDLAYALSAPVLGVVAGSIGYSPRQIGSTRLIGR